MSSGHPSRKRNRSNSPTETLTPRVRYLMTVVFPIGNLLLFLSERVKKKKETDVWVPLRVRS